MKNLSIWQKLRLLRVANKRMHRRKRAAERRRKLKNSAASKDTSTIEDGWHSITVYRRGKVRQSIARERKPMLENFCLIENYDAVAARHQLFQEDP